jgi:hypothetical protein
MKFKLPIGTHRGNISESPIMRAGKESHHMPPWASFSDKLLGKGKGGKGAAILMDKDDHKLTPSHGTQTGSRRFISSQKQLVGKGYNGYKEAFERDVNALRDIKDPSNSKQTLFTKYSTQIDKARNYINSPLGKKNITNGIAQTRNQSNKPKIDLNKPTKPSKGFSTKPTKPTKIKNNAIKQNPNLQTMGKKSIKSVDSIKNKVKRDTGSKAVNSVAKGTQKTATTSAKVVAKPLTK